MGKEACLKANTIFETVVFYPIEIPIFYKAIKNVKSISEESDDIDLNVFLIYLEPKFEVLLRNIQEGKISSANIVFHIYEIPYLCALIDIYLSEKCLNNKEEEHLYEILERFEILYDKHYSDIKKFNFYPITKKVNLLREIQEEKDKFFKIKGQRY